MWNIPVVLQVSAFYHRKLVTFVTAKNAHKDEILDIISNPLNFFEFLKVVLKTMVLILMMPAKFSALGFLKTKVFRNEDHEVTIFVLDIFNKFSSVDSSCIVDMVMCPTFSKSSTFIGEVIITSLLVF